MNDSTCEQGSYEESRGALIYILIWHFADTPIPLLGKFDRENVWQSYFFWAFGKKIWWMNRSANKLSANLNGLILGNHRWLAKLANLSCYTVSNISNIF